MEPYDHVLTGLRPAERVSDDWAAWPPGLGDLGFVETESLGCCTWGND
jgi:hypothetical protein